MKRLTVALGAFVVLLAAVAPAQADYSIVRWTSGDCKIWRDAPGTETIPAGSGWAIVAGNLPYLEAAQAVLDDLYRRGVCR